jgi:hypothetical protein
MIAAAVATTTGVTGIAIAMATGANGIETATTTAPNHAAVGPVANRPTLAACSAPHERGPSFQALSDHGAPELVLWRRLPVAP